MRRIIPTIILVLVLVFALFACSTRPLDGPEDTGTPDTADTGESGGTETGGEPSYPTGGIADRSHVLSPDRELEGNATVEPVNTVNLTVVAVGDNLIHPNIYLDAALRGTPEKTYDFLPMYELVRPYLSSADIAFINQETLMAGAEYGYTGYPCFNCPQQLGLDMVEIGFDIINMANNHMLDKGDSGLRSTIDFWHTQPVTILGGHYDQNDYDTIRVTEYDGFKIAWLSYTYGTNGITLPYGSELVVPYIDEDRIVSDLKRAEQLGDITIVSIHWGLENTHVPTDEQRHLAQVIADNGAAVILGHHSHTLQPIEWIETERGRTLCIYSLGNFASGQARPMNMVAGMFTFRIEDGKDGGYEICDPILYPTVNYYDWNWYNTKIYPLDQYTEEIAVTHGLGNPNIYGAYLSPTEAREIVLGVIDSEFLPEYMK